MNRGAFQRLSRLRLREARVLLRNGNNEGTYYLAGYAVECALKTCIAKKTKRHDFPDKKVVVDAHTHDLTTLARIAGLLTELDKEIKREANFGKNWTVVKDWNEERRYQFPGEKDAKDLYAAITARTYGVMRWIRRRW